VLETERNDLITTHESLTKQANFKLSRYDVQEDSDLDVTQPAVKSYEKARKDLSECFANLEFNVDETKQVTEEYLKSTDETDDSIVRPTKAMQQLEVIYRENKWFNRKLEELAERQLEVREERREAKRREMGGQKFAAAHKHS
jgi:membrane-bound lytic murein transglycosylase MltF